MLYAGWSLGHLAPGNWALSGGRTGFYYKSLSLCGLAPSPKSIVVWKVSDLKSCSLSKKTLVSIRFWTGLIHSMILLKAVPGTSSELSSVFFSCFIWRIIWIDFDVQCRPIKMTAMNLGISDKMTTLVTELLHLPHQVYVLWFILSSYDICKLQMA